MRKNFLWLLIFFTIIVSSIMLINKFNNQIQDKNTIIENLQLEVNDINQKYNTKEKENKNLKKEIKELKDKNNTKEKNTVSSRSITTSRKSKSPSKKGKKYSPKSKSNSSKWSDLELLARIINAEAGGCTDEHQLLVGNVVLNRVESSKFPNTIYGVIYQKGQYSPTWNGSINKTPSKKAYKNAKRLLNGERFCPSNVVFQANFKQGKGIYKSIKTSYSTTYFCY